MGRKKKPVAGKPSPVRASPRRAEEVDRLRARLTEVVAPGAISAWLDTPNEAFDGLKPLEVIERGEIDRLWNMIYYIDSGVPS